jgi:hypothetical protein
MTVNVLNIPGEIIAVAIGAGILLVFAITLILGRVPRVPPGSRGYRPEDENEPEVVRPDGYIDSFAHDIEEAGGSLIVWVAVVGILGWWLIYLIVNWQPHIYPFMSNVWVPR